MASLLLYKHNIAVGDLCDQISVNKSTFPAGFLKKKKKKIKGERPGKDRFWSLD